MNASTKRRSPAGTGRQDFAESNAATPFYPYGRRSAYLPRDWRERVAARAPAYYQARIERLSQPNAQGWAQGRCPFHEDRQASLSVNLQHGGWRCFAGCGCGDLLSFHCRVTGLDFKPAVRDLLGLH